MTKTANGAFRGARRFQIVEPIASPKALVVIGLWIEGVAVGGAKIIADNNLYCGVQKYKTYHYADL